MTYKSTLVLLCLTIFGDLTYAQSKREINVLNACIEYLILNENVTSLYLKHPSIESFCDADLRRPYNNYKLPFDSIELVNIRKSLPRNNNSLWPNLELGKTTKLTENQLDSVRKLNTKIYLRNNKIVDNTDIPEIKIIPCYTFSNPVFTKDKKYAIVRIFDYCSHNGSIHYKYLLLEAINSKWVVLNELPGGSLCG